MFLLLQYFFRQLNLTETCNLSLFYHSPALCHAVCVPDMCLLCVCARYVCLQLFLWMQHLAFLDLAYLSDKCHWRRLEVFSLSQRGGHPVTWRSVCQSCLSQIHNLMTSLQTELVSVSSSKLSAQTPTTVNWSAPFAGKLLNAISERLSVGVSVVIVSCVVKAVFCYGRVISVWQIGQLFSSQCGDAWLVLVSVVMHGLF